MKQTIFQQSRDARQSFTALAVMLLVLPLFFAILKQPSPLWANGYALCETIPGRSAPVQQMPGALCDNCLPGTACPVSANAAPEDVLALLVPPLRLEGALEFETASLQSQTDANGNHARGPPSPSL